MWDYYKKTFAMVQFASVLVGYMVYSASNRAWSPALVVFAFMHVSAVLGAMWANRLRRKIEAADAT